MPEDDTKAKKIITLRRSAGSPIHMRTPKWAKTLTLARKLKVDQYNNTNPNSMTNTTNDLSGDKIERKSFVRQDFDYSFLEQAKQLEHGSFMGFKKTYISDSKPNSLSVQGVIDFLKGCKMFNVILIREFLDSKTYDDPTQVKHEQFTKLSLYEQKIWKLYEEARERERKNSSDVLDYDNFISEHKAKALELDQDVDTYIFDNVLVPRFGEAAKEAAQAERMGWGFGQDEDIYKKETEDVYRFFMLNLPGQLGGWTYKPNRVTQYFCFERDGELYFETDYKQYGELMNVVFASLAKTQAVETIVLHSDKYNKVSPYYWSKELILPAGSSSATYISHLSLPDYDLFKPNLNPKHFWLIESDWLHGDQKLGDKHSMWRYKEA